MAATAASPGLSLGNIFGAIEDLKNGAAALFTDYENDEPVRALAVQVMELRIKASRLESTLDAVVNALDLLEG